MMMMMMMMMMMIMIRTDLSFVNSVANYAAIMPLPWPGRWGHCTLWVAPCVSVHLHVCLPLKK